MKVHQATLVPNRSTISSNLPSSGASMTTLDSRSNAFLPERPGKECVSRKERLASCKLQWRGEV